MEISEIFERIRPRANSIEQWPQWSQHLSELFQQVPNSVDRALIAGACSHLPAYAFASGYQAALAKLYPQSDSKKHYAFCVTETAGNHPKAIQTTLTPTDKGYVLNGNKSFITAIEQADAFLVAAQLQDQQTEQVQARKVIKLIYIERHQKGVQLNSLPPLPFVSELSHGSMALTDVEIGEQQILEGDGYEDYVKPFRTIEDIHVSAAMLGFWLGLAFKYEWSGQVMERLLACYLQYRSLADLCAKDFGTHVALAGALECQHELTVSLNKWIEQLPCALQEICKRDKKLEQVAQKARELRLEKAWKELWL